MRQYTRQFVLMHSINAYAQPYITAQLLPFLSVYIFGLPVSPLVCFLNKPIDDLLQGLEVMLMKSQVKW
jgi:hypothetical protein